MTQVSIDSLTLHPAADRVPMAGAADLETLRASLRLHGQQDPIDVTPDGQILDGRTRWIVLRDMGARVITVRAVEVPANQQTNYIVDRALARRHLTAEQKRALNALLRELVVEVMAHPKTGEEVRIGKGQSHRAETLGVTRETVRRWDDEESSAINVATDPSHQRLSNGRVFPIHPDKEPREPKGNGRAHRGQRPLVRKRHAPPWLGHFTNWCRGSARPEDRKILLRLDRELHDALRQNEIPCEH